MATITNNLTTSVTIVDSTGQSYDIAAGASITIDNKLIKYQDLDDGISKGWITVTGFDQILVGMATETTLAAVRDAVQPLNTKTVDRSASWQYSGAVAVTTPVTVKAAAAAGVRNYTTGLQFQNTSATATTLIVQDGTTTIWQGNATANMASPAPIKFNVPLKGTAATALTVTCATTGANVLVNAQGYEGA